MSERGRVRLALSGVLLALGLSAVVSSCRSVLDLDGYEDGTEALCTLLVRCFSGKGLTDCRGHVQGRFFAAQETSQASWLEYLDGNHCLADCESALRCLDEPPVCAGRRVSCATKEECCG